MVGGLGAIQRLFNYVRIRFMNLNIVTVSGGFPHGQNALFINGFWRYRAITKTEVIGFKRMASADAGGVQIWFDSPEQVSVFVNLGAKGD